MGPKKDTENDPAWAHGERVGNDRHKVRCKYCNKILSGGGIHRFKCHLGHVSGNTKPCPKVLEEVKEEMRALLQQGGKKRDRGEEKKESERIVGSKSKLMIESIPIKTTTVVFCTPHGVRVDLESSATFEPSSLPSTTSDPSKVASSSSTMLNSDLYLRLQSLVEGASENWEYAFFWAWSADVSSVTTVLDCGIGYHREGMDGPKRMFLLSEDTCKSVNVPTSLPWKAFFGRKLIWVVGTSELEDVSREWAQQAYDYGFETMVFIPVSNGVVELGSTDWIDFCSLEIFDWKSIVSRDTPLSQCSRKKKVCMDAPREVREEMSEGRKRGRAEESERIVGSKLMIESVPIETTPVFRPSHGITENRVDLESLATSGPSLPSAPPTATIISSTTTSDPSKVASLSSTMLNADLYLRLQSLVEVASENWQYAMFWAWSADVFGVTTVLDGGIGYHKEGMGMDGPKRMVLLSEDTYKSVNVPTSLPWKAFFGGKLIWVLGHDKMENSSCERVLQAYDYGFGTMVFIPVSNGVVELGSTDCIYFCSLEIFDWESIASPDTSLSVCSKNHFGRMNHWADVSQVTSDPSSVQLPSTSAAPPTAMIGSSTIKSNPRGNQFRAIAVMSALLSRFVAATSERWVYAIFWRLSIDVSGTSLFWCGCFYNALCGVSQNSDLKEEMEEEELVQEFFDEFVDEPPSIVNCYCLSSRELWVAGRKQLEASSFRRAHKARSYGYQTMVWIPIRNGVVELGSTFYIKDQTSSTARCLDSCWENFDLDFILS